MNDQFYEARVKPSGNGNGNGRGDGVEGLLTAKEAAAFLHVSLNTLWRMERRNLIMPYRTPGGHRRYSVDMLRSYLEHTRVRS